MALRRRRTSGTAMVEWLIVCIFIAITGAKLVYEFGRVARCKMASGTHNTECTGASNIKLTPSDDGCIGVVCKTATP